MKISKKIMLIPLSMILVFSSISCNKTDSGNTSFSVSTSENSEQIKYNEKEVNVIYANKNINYKTNLRFYEEAKDIPYIGIKQYYKMLIKDTPLASKGDLEIIKNNNEYKIETPRGGSARIDVISDIFECDNFALFNSTNYNDMSSDTGIFEFDGLPWVKVKNIKYNKEPSLFKVDFSKYKINLFGDNDDIYFPFNTACDLFLNDNLLNCAYNQKDIYVINGANNESLTSFEGYATPIFEKKLSKEYSEYNYMELCFLYDKLLGRPNRTAIERNYNLEKGLDYALSNNELGKEIKKLFLSSEVSDYFAATQFFNALFGDGGHSNYTQLNTYISLLNQNEQAKFADTSTEIINVINSIMQKGYPELSDLEKQNLDHLLVRTSREKMLGLNLDETNTLKTICGTDSYYRKDNTAIIFVDNFMGEFYNKSLWNSYYNNERDTIPFGNNLGGCVGALYNGLRRAKEDNVSNVIIDLSSNTGGSLDELAYLCAILTNKKSFSMFNYLTNQIQTAELEIDINLDKKFDENDNISMVDGFNLAVISSQNGFSCGGISPIYLHEANIFTMGDISGGGSCSIYNIYDCYGLKHIASSPHQIFTLNGASIDSIRNKSCDLFIDAPIVEGNKNYDGFFDIDKLTEYVTSYYSKK